MSSRTGKNSECWEALQPCLTSRGMVDGRPWMAQDIKAMLNDTLTWTVMLNDTAVSGNAQCRLQRHRTAGQTRGHSHILSSVVTSITAAHSHSKAYLQLPCQQGPNCASAPRQGIVQYWPQRRNRACLARTEPVPPRLHPQKQCRRGLAGHSGQVHWHHLNSIDFTVMFAQTPMEMT